MDECVSPNLSSHNSVVLCAAAVKAIQNPKPRICLETHPMDNVRRNRALFLGGIPFLVRVLDSWMIMVKLFFQVPYPFQTAAPFQDNFGETPSIIFHCPRLGLKLVHSSHHPHSNHFTSLHSYSSPHHSFWW